MNFRTWEELMKSEDGEFIHISEEKRVEMYREYKNRNKPIRFRALKDVYWDDWGCMRRVFVKGRIYEGVKHSCGSISGYSPYYDVSDGLSPDEYEII